MHYAPAAFWHFFGAPFPHDIGALPPPRDVRRLLATRSESAPLFGATGGYGHTGHMPAWARGHRMRMDAPEFHPRSDSCAYLYATPIPSYASPPLLGLDPAHIPHATPALRDGSNSSRLSRVGRPPHPASLRG